jgi:ankyrin repeat protein
MKKSLPLFLALFGKNEAKFLKLAKSGNFPFTETDPSGRMLLSSAVIAEMPEAVALLLDRQSEPLAKDEKGWTALHFSSYCNNVAIAKQLMAVFPSVDVKDNAGNTPLGRAVIEEHVEMVGYLISVGADAGLKNSNGDSPLDLSRTSEHGEIIGLLGEG